jgi:hypothetical protein
MTSRAAKSSRIVSQLLSPSLCHVEQLAKLGQGQPLNPCLGHYREKLRSGCSDRPLLLGPRGVEPLPRFQEAPRKVGPTRHPTSV